MNAVRAPDWIAVDWGTSNLRLWAMSDSTGVLGARHSADGMGAMASRDDFEPALRRLAGDWLTDSTPVIACGMVGSRQGWIEAPYATLPCPPLSSRFVRPATTLDVQIIPGLRQTAPAADVMRGEETQIAGFLAQNPRWDGIVCLPGTHTKWAHVSADEVVSFQTAMTGELFAAISSHTVLRHALGGGGGGSERGGWDDSGFAAGLSEGLSHPARFATRLFALRADTLLNDLSGDTARAWLSGMLIGMELAATRPYWLGQQVAVIGEGNLARLYVQALANQSVPATQVNADHVTRAGLTAAYRQSKDH